MIDVSKTFNHSQMAHYRQISMKDCDISSQSDIISWFGKCIIAIFVLEFYVFDFELCILQLQSLITMEMSFCL